MWSVPLNYSCLKGAVVANIDNSPDGSMEVIVAPEGGLNPILIYSADGQLLQSIYPGVNANYGAIAVADLDGDDDLEIIRACGNGVYVWHHDGKNFTGSPNQDQALYSNNAYSFKSSVVVCNLQGTGKVILTSALNNNNGKGYIFGIKTNGDTLSGWGPAVDPINYIPNNNFSQEIAVGDLYDGNLKVVAMGAGEVKVWNHTGSLLRTIPVSNLDPQNMAPLLADVDGDNEAEIIFGSANDHNIYAYKVSTGVQKALGFPLKTEVATMFTPAIADVDGDGKNELMIGGTMFETSGRPDRIEWGSERHDPRNTGEYFKLCEPTIIRTDTVWNSNNTICGDIIVKSGTLTINNGCSITMDNTSSIIVMEGATLKVDNGNLLNCNVNVLPGGNLIQDNNGYIKIRNNALFRIQLGATWKVLTSGTIDN